MSQAIAASTHVIVDPPNGLSATLRAETRAAHAAAEKRFVRAAKAVPGSGPWLLMNLNFGLTSWLGRVAPLLPSGRLRDETAVFTEAVSGAHARSAIGEPDRARESADLVAPMVDDPVLADVAEIVGAAYAICGSALGASALAGAWRDETDVRWVRFCAASRALERRWPLFAAALNEWGDAHHESAHRAAISGADRAFAHAGALVDALPRAR